MRGTLSVMFVWSLASFRFQLKKRIHKGVAGLFTLVCACQFHLLFYASRTLPNTYAALFVNVAFSYWLQDELTTCLCILTFAGVVLRAELVLLFIPIFISACVQKQFRGGAISGPVRAVGACACTALVALVITVPVDSLLWRRLLWPEAEVLYFNTILNKSHEWGTAPFHWYFTSALPRALMGTVVLVPGSLVYDDKMRPFALPVISFVLLYSLLPHKELRFILYAVPMLNACAAATLQMLNEKKDQDKWCQHLFRSLYVCPSDSLSVSLVCLFV